MAKTGDLKVANSAQCGDELRGFAADGLDCTSSKALIVQETPMSRKLLTLLALNLGLLAHGAAHGQSVTDARPQQREPPSAKQLIAGILADQSKIDSVHSLYLRIVKKDTTPPERIAERTSQLKIDLPTADISPERYPNLRPVTLEEWEIAYDANRIRHMFHSHDDFYGLQVWDGHRFIWEERDLVKGRGALHGADPEFPIDTQEAYYLQRKPMGLDAQTLFMYISWLKMSPHVLPGQEVKLIGGRLRWNCGPPENYQIAGERDVRGHHCRILEDQEDFNRVYVGEQDRRLYGYDLLFPPVETTSENQSHLAGNTSIPDAASTKAANRLKALQAAVGKPSEENYLDDYREIAPGFWFPAKQGYAQYMVGDNGRILLLQRDLQLQQAKINEPLNDELFKVDLRDGVEVRDETHDLPLVYVQKADRTDDEWKEILDEAAQKNKRSKN